MTKISAIELALDRIKWDLAVQIFEENTRQLSRLIGTKYDPNQPRDDHGRWADGSGDQRANDDSVNAAEQPNIVTAARRISPALEAQCLLQYLRDSFQCKMVGLRACYGQAALRYANCLAGLPIPPLNY